MTPKPILFFDFETRSSVDLRATGVHKYAEHPDTDIWLASYAFDDEEPQTIWFRGPLSAGDLTLPTRIKAHIEAGGILYAHNAEFERVMWRDVLTRGRPEIPVPMVEQWYDTAAEAAAMALPRNLGNLTVALGLEEKKDMVGHRLMLQLSRPRKLGSDGKPIWWDDVEKLTRFATYGLQDIRAERAVYHAVRRLNERERAIYVLDQRINDRGVGLDVPLALAMKQLAEQEIDAQDAKLLDVTEGKVEAATQVARLRQWLAEKGVETESLDKAAIRELLLRSDLPEDVATALHARADAAKSSVKKLGTMLDVVGKYGRMRGLQLYHGASTGRWSGRSVQPHNFPRPDIDDIESYIPSVLDGSLALSAGGHSTLAVLSSMLRSTIVSAPGYELMVADYSAIEARGVAWLAGEKALLDAFALKRCVYCEMAASIYDKPLELIVKGTHEYTIGKAAVLGAGYGMGGKRRPDGAPAKFQAMVKLQTGLDLSDEFSEHVIDTYRARYPAIPAAWYATEDAAIQAVRTPGEVFAAGPLRFTRRGAYLWMALPSGRALAYFGPKLVERATPWGTSKEAIEISHTNSLTHQWERGVLYGGLLVENAVQAISRDVMADGMMRVEEAGYPVVLTVHDEVVSEIPKGEGSVENFAALLTRTPTWAPGLPVAAEGWRGERYRK